MDLTRPCPSSRVSRRAQKRARASSRCRRHPMNMSKRHRDEGCSLVQDVLMELSTLKCWQAIQLTVKELKSKENDLDSKINQILNPRPGGSKKGRKIVKRDFQAAYEKLFVHYFSTNPIYTDQHFRRRYRVPKPIFFRVYDACCQHPYFKHKANAAGRWGIHPLVKVTAVFRHFAYGIAPDALDENFGVSETTVLDSREIFCDVSCLLDALRLLAYSWMQVVIDAFEEKYLPGIDHNLMSRLCAQHAELGWPGLIGSLDCSHWEWFRCPKSLHGEYRRGDKDHPTVVYEGACDSDLFIWHCYFALPGSCNDLNVLDTSPLLFAIASGSTMFDYSVLGHFYNQPYVHFKIKQLQS